MRRLALLLALSATAPLFAACSSGGGGFDFAGDCKARMRDADPSGGVGAMQAELRSQDFRTDVYVTGTVSTRGGPVADRFHCVYSGDALMSNDRKPAPSAPADQGNAPPPAPAAPVGAESGPAAAPPAALPGMEGGSAEP